MNAIDRKTLALSLRMTAALLDGGADLREAEDVASLRYWLAEADRVLEEAHPHPTTTGALIDEFESAVLGGSGSVEP
jgi:hypothetical protein